MNEAKAPETERSEPFQRLGEIGLSNFAPYLMNRIMGRYNADLRQEMTGLGLTTPKMRALAVLSVIDDLPISDLAVYAVVEQSTLSRALEQLASDGLVRRDPDPNDSRVTRIGITETIGIVPFVDAGLVSANQDFSGSEFKLGAGLGLRYRTPFGPLRIDVAVPLNKGPLDPDYGIYAGIGQAF